MISMDISHQEPAMDYSWYPAYREAILEIDQAKMRERILFAEHELVASCTFFPWITAERLKNEKPSRTL
jgi:hypothetical protein